MQHLRSSTVKECTTNSFRQFVMADKVLRGHNDAKTLIARDERNIWIDIPLVEEQRTGDIIRRRPV